MTRSKPPIPKEHGAWAVLYVPLFVGAALAGAYTWNVFLLALSALGVFMSYVPVHALLRHRFVAPLPEPRLREAMTWSAIYLGFGIAFMISLLVQGYWLLLLIGMPGAAAFLGTFALTRATGKTLLSDLVAVFGLSLSGLCSWYVVRAEVTTEALVVWLLNLLFFWCSVFYVHMKIRAATSKPEVPGMRWRWSVGALNVVYHLFVVALVVGLAVYRMTKLYAIVAFLPMVVHALLGTIKLSRRVSFQRLGFLLLAQSVLFGVLLWHVWE